MVLKEPPASLASADFEAAENLVCDRHAPGGTPVDLAAVRKEENLATGLRCPHRGDALFPHGCPSFDDARTGRHNPKTPAELTVSSYDR